MTNDTVICADCGAMCKPRGIGAGYAVTWDDSVKVCYRCAAIRERAGMVKDGAVTAYVAESHGDYRVTTWAGDSLGLVTRVKHGRHNIAGHRLDVWFIGPDGMPWHGVNIGDNQVLRCKRLKSPLSHQPLSVCPRLAPRR